MKSFPIKAEFMGYMYKNKTKTPEWRCPNFECQTRIENHSYRYCPYCGQRVILIIPKSANIVSIFINRVDARARTEF